MSQRDAGKWKLYHVREDKNLYRILAQPLSVFRIGDVPFLNLRFYQGDAIRAQLVERAFRVDLIVSVEKSEAPKIKKSTIERVPKHKLVAVPVDAFDAFEDVPDEPVVVVGKTRTVRANDYPASHASPTSLPIDLHNKKPDFSKLGTTQDVHDKGEYLYGWLKDHDDSICLLPFQDVIKKANAAVRAKFGKTMDGSYLNAVVSGHRNDFVLDCEAFTQRRLQQLRDYDRRKRADRVR